MRAILKAMNASVEDMSKEAKQENLETLIQEFKSYQKQFGYLIDLLTDEFEDEVIVLTNRQIEAELKELKEYEDELVSEVKTAVNDQRKHKAKLEYQ